MKHRQCWMQHTNRSNSSVIHSNIGKYSVIKVAIDANMIVINRSNSTPDGIEFSYESFANSHKSASWTRHRSQLIDLMIEMHCYSFCWGIYMRTWCAVMQLSRHPRWQMCVFQQRQLDFRSSMMNPKNAIQRYRKAEKLLYLWCGYEFYRDRSRRKHLVRRFVWKMRSQPVGQLAQTGRMGADLGAIWDQHVIRILGENATFGLPNTTSIDVERSYVLHRFNSENHTFCWSKCDSGDVRKCAYFLRRGYDLLRTGATFGRRSASKIADSSQTFFPQHKLRVF